MDINSTTTPVPGTTPAATASATPRISLSKGQNISLSKEAPTMKKMRLGLGWCEAKFASDKAFDCDVSCFCLEKDGEGFILKRDTDLVFFNNKVSTDGAVKHGGDNRTGAGDGDDEKIFIELDKVGQNILNLSFIVTIDGAEEKHQTFGMIDGAYIALYNDETNELVAKYSLTDDFSTETAVQFASLYRDDSGSWRFKAVGAGYKAGLVQFAANYKAAHLFRA